MRIRSFARIALRNIPRRKVRNALTILGVALGVALLVGVNIAFESAITQFVDTLVRSSGSVDISITSATGTSFQDSILSEVRSIEGVVDSSGRVSGSGNAIFWDGLEESSAALSIFGVDPGNDFDYLNPEYTNITGSKTLTEDSIVIDARLNYTIGQRIKIRVRSRYYWFQVIGQYNLATELSGTSSVTRYRAYVDLPKAQEMFGTWGRLNRIIVRVENISTTEKIVKNIQDKLGAEFNVTPDKQRILDQVERSIEGFRTGLVFMSTVANAVAMVIVFNTVYMNVKERIYEIGILRSIGASKNHVFFMFLLESSLLGVLGSIIGLGIGRILAEYYSSQLASTFYAEQVTVNFSMEIAGTGIFAGIITTIIGGMIPSIIAGRTDILRALKPYMGSSAQKRLHLYLIAGGIPLLVAGIYLRTQYVPERSSAFLVGFLSFPLMIGGLILITAGIIRTAGRIIEYTLSPFLRRNSKIASRNLGRNLVRTTISFTLIAMTLSFVVSTGGIQGSVDAGIKQTVTDLFESDIVIISGGDPLEREFWKRLIKLENGTLIDKAAPVKIIGTKLQSLTRTQNVSVPLTAIHTKNGAPSDKYCAYSDVINIQFTPETPPDAYQKLHNLNTIIISRETAETLEAEVGSKVRVLSLLPVEIAPGVIIWKNVWRTFTIIGIVAQGADISGWGTSSSFVSNEMCYISYHTLNLQWGYYEDEASTFYVKVKPEFEDKIGYARDIILNNYGKRFGIGVVTRIDILDAVKDRIDQTSQLFELVVLFAVFIAAIGMSGIMVMNIQERKREIGVFRSQGMSRKQVVTMIAGEATIIGTIGLILGTISGLLFYWGVTIVMNAYGFKVPVIIPYESIQTASLLAIGVSISSIIYPMYKASKLTIIDALRGQ